ncbi:MAG: DUF2807 domain-containing protein [Maribacter sp.]
MKSRYYFFFFLFSVGVVFAQGNSTIRLQKYAMLKVTDQIAISLTKGNENKLVLIDANTDELSINQNNGLLKLSKTQNNYATRTTLNATLYYTDDLSFIDASENAQIRSNEIMKASHLDIRAQEAGVIHLAIENQSVNIRSNTSSEIRLKGSTKTQEVMVNTMAKVYNKSLKTESSTATVLAGGIAEIYASQNMTARVKAGSIVRIYGHPKKVTKEDTFGGEIKMMN